MDSGRNEEGMNSAYVLYYYYYPLRQAGKEKDVENFGRDSLGDWRMVSEAVAMGTILWSDVLAGCEGYRRIQTSRLSPVLSPSTQLYTQGA